MESFKGFRLSNTPSLSLSGVKTWARLVDVYDGDTVTLLIPFKEEIFKFQCRVRSIDTCEMKSKLKQNKDTAIRARNRVLQLSGHTMLDLATPYTRKQIRNILDDTTTVVWVVCHGFDKYGRLLVDVYKNDQPTTPSFARILLDEKLAYAYNGDTKISEDAQATNLG